MALMACAVRRGEIEIHAFCLLGTHFHILCRVPEGGDLSRAMMQIQNAYTRWFNRRNRRDGPLFRGRFRSKPVDSDRYWLTLFKYIDFNPVGARVCAHPSTYEFGSARAYAAGAAPRWLCTSQAKALFAESGDRSLSAGYLALVGQAPTAEERELVESRLHAPAAADPTDDLLQLAAPGFKRWVVEKARNADGLEPSLPLASARAIEAELQLEARTLDGLDIRLTRKRLDARGVLLAGLLHGVAGCGCEAIARRVCCNNSTVSRWVRAHRAAIALSSDYAAVAARVTKAAMERTHGLRRQ